MTSSNTESYILHFKNQRLLKLKCMNVQKMNKKILN